MKKCTKFGFCWVKAFSAMIKCSIHQLGHDLLTMIKCSTHQPGYDLLAMIKCTRSPFERRKRSEPLT